MFPRIFLGTRLCDLWGIERTRPFWLSATPTGGLAKGCTTSLFGGRSFRLVRKYRLCWPKNVVKGWVIKTATHATFDRVFFGQQSIYLERRNLLSAVTFVHSPSWRETWTKRTIWWRRGRIWRGRWMRPRGPWESPQRTSTIERAGMWILVAGGLHIHLLSDRRSRCVVLLP